MGGYIKDQRIRYKQHPTTAYKHHYDQEQNDPNNIVAINGAHKHPKNASFGNVSDIASSINTMNTNNTNKSSRHSSIANSQISHHYHGGHGSGHYYHGHGHPHSVHSQPHHHPFHSIHHQHSGHSHRTQHSALTNRSSVTPTPTYDMTHSQAVYYPHLTHSNVSSNNRYSLHSNHSQPDNAYYPYQPPQNRHYIDPYPIHAQYNDHPYNQHAQRQSHKSRNKRYRNSSRQKKT